MLHVHVLLVAPLGAGHMEQPGTDQHEGGVAVREAAHHTGSAANFPVEPINLKFSNSDCRGGGLPLCVFSHDPFLRA